MILLHDNNYCLQVKFEVGAPISDIVAKMLAKNVEDRYQGNFLYIKNYSIL